MALTQLSPVALPGQRYSFVAKGGAVTAGSVAESLTLSDTVTESIVTLQAVSESLALTDVADASIATLQAVSESLTLTDAASGANASSQSVSESLSLTDATVNAITTSQAVSESLSLADEATGASSSLQAASDALALSDATSSVNASQQTAGDSLMLSDEATSTLTAVEAVSESLLFADTVSGSTGEEEGAAADSLLLADTVSGTVTVESGPSTPAPEVPTSCSGVVLRTDIHDDTLQAIQQIWVAPGSNLFSIFGQAVQAGVMKPPTTYPNAQVEVEFLRSQPYSKRVAIDTRKVTITIRGSKDQVDDGLPLVLDVFHDEMTIALPSEDNCMGWRALNGGDLREEKATYQGTDIWAGIVEGEVISVRSR